MTARELMDLPAGDFDGHKMSEFTRSAHEKLREAKIGPATGTHGMLAEKGEETLYKSIKREGIKEPVSIDFDRNSDELPTINDGHHRVVVAHALNPNMYIPVKYESGFADWDISSKDKQ